MMQIVTLFYFIILNSINQLLLKVSDVAHEKLWNLDHSATSTIICVTLNLYALFNSPNKFRKYSKIIVDCYSPNDIFMNMKLVVM